MSIEDTLNERRKSLMRMRNERRSAIEGWERLIASNTALIDSYHAEIAQIDALLDKREGATYSLTITSDAPIDIQEGP